MLGNFLCFYMSNLSFSDSRKSPRMQNNNLPHSPSAPVDSKTIVQNTNCPSDQTHLQSASSSKVVSTVPLSSNSASSPACSANETASSSNVQTQVSDSTDASRLPTPEVGVANPSGNVSSSTDSHKLQNNHQCNTRSVSNGAEHTDSVNTERNVQNDTPLLEHKSSQEESNTPTNEVQTSTDVNKSPTANVTESLKSDGAKNQPLDSSVSQPSNNDNDKCKKLSDPSESSDSSPSSITPVPNDNNEVVASASDRDACTVEMKKSPIAQIISVDNLPIQPQVIEVPSQQSSPAVPTTLAKCGPIAEVNSISPFVPSSQAQSLSATETSCPEGIASSSSSSSNVPTNTTVLVPHSDSFPPLSLPCSTSAEPSRVLLLNHVDAMQETPLSANKASPAPSSSTNESSMDSIDEERKRCMQLAEIPTSTPGPPHIDSPVVSSSSKADDAPEKVAYSNMPPHVKPVNKAVSKPSAMDFKDLPSEGRIFLCIFS